jgi:hypothetical protein
MELLGEQVIGADRQTVWNALNDPDILKRCIPGCEEVVQLAENQLQVRLMVKIGPVRSRFAGTMSLQDIHEPERCELVFEGTGAAGFAKGGSSVVLSEQGKQTKLNYSAKASIGGKLGQIGGRLIESSARKMADEFFSEFQAVLSGETESSTSAAGTTAGQTASAGKARPASGAQASTVAASASATHVNTASTGAAAPAPAVSHVVRAEAVSGWRPELYRAFWFCLGVASTLFISHWFS